MIKIFSKLGVEGNVFNMIKGIYESLKHNITLNNKKLKAFPLKSGKGQRCPQLPLQFNIIVKILVRAIWEEKEMRDIQMIKKELKLSIHR